MSMDMQVMNSDVCACSILQIIDSENPELLHAVDSFGEQETSRCEYHSNYSDPDTLIVAVSGESHRKWSVRSHLESTYDYLNYDYREEDNGPVLARLLDDSLVSISFSPSFLRIMVVDAPTLTTIDKIAVQLWADSIFGPGLVVFS